MSKATLFNFDKVADAYDSYYQNDLGKKIDLLEKNLVELFFNEINKKEVLEIGCGTGHWTSFLSELGLKVTGIDISEKMLEKAKSKNIPNATFEVHDATNLPFANESIENIVCITSLEFIENKEKALKEMHRVLKKNGTILIGTLNKDSEWYTVNKDNEIFNSADLYDYNSLYKAMSLFGAAQIQSCVFFKNGNLLDENPDFSGDKEKGAFLVGVTQKLFL